MAHKDNFREFIKEMLLFGDCATMYVGEKYLKFVTQYNFYLKEKRRKVYVLWNVEKAHSLNVGNSYVINSLTDFLKDYNKFNSIYIATENNSDDASEYYISLNEWWQDRWNNIDLKDVSKREMDMLKTLKGKYKRPPYFQNKEILEIGQNKLTFKDKGATPIVTTLVKCHFQGIQGLVFIEKGTQGYRDNGY